MKQLNDTERAQLRKLFEANGLTKDDIFVHRNFTIVKRSGIERIQAAQNIEVKFEVVQCDRDFVAMKAFAWKRTTPKDASKRLDLQARKTACPNTSLKSARNAPLAAPSSKSATCTNTAFSVKMKTSTAMGDWIDAIFDELEGRVVDVATRSRLERLLETAFTEGDEFDAYLARIDADDLTVTECDDLFRRLTDQQPRVPDLYAPSQTALARWIKSFC